MYFCPKNCHFTKTKKSHFWFLWKFREIWQFFSSRKILEKNLLTFWLSYDFFLVFILHTIQLLSLPFFPFRALSSGFKIRRKIGWTRITQCVLVEHHFYFTWKVAERHLSTWQKMTEHDDSLPIKMTKRRIVSLERKYGKTAQHTFFFSSLILIKRFAVIALEITFKMRIYFL